MAIPLEDKNERMAKEEITALEGARKNQQ